MYIAQWSSLEYIVGKDCQLVAFPDDSGLDNIQYAIAVQKDSPWLGQINEAIKQLKASGKLAELKKKYWTNSCQV